MKHEVLKCTIWSEQVLYGQFDLCDLATSLRLGDNGRPIYLVLPILFHSINQIWI